ncbi:double-strand break repair helicase AddA [uncultured Sphingomonas sp.]|uniref:double-strand break repair helicase AddA n=1 Tax=uncultured Sphingomonas sp. TaxID=158754 RepID=UPI0025FCA3AB|nr:double-strand break repair helicase AddA [uncultured Sphingomonas sp.]
MSPRLQPLKALQPDQARAADPAIHAALSASAGTGKTQVLTARVMRLLLGGAKPETILCLTFTKAGAAEMANRIGDRLARWVRLPGAELRKELFALGEDNSSPMLERARRLFAEVLDAPGGLRIQTIHSFAQALLAAFPAEAGITPGFRPIEGREEQLLARRTLATLIAEAEARGDEQLIADVQALSRRLGERDAERYLLNCARHPEAMTVLARPDQIESGLRSLLGLPEGSIDELLAARCHDDSLDCALLGAIVQGHREWNTKTGHGFADDLEAWLQLAPHERCRALDRLAQVVFTQGGERRKLQAGLLKAAPDAQDHCDRLAEEVAELLSLQRKAELVAVQAAGLRAGATFADAYTRAKRSTGVADFDDLIRWTRTLLATPGMGEWVRYKLDQRTDHLLVDEAQDTNADQWAIVEALTEEFFSGEGARGHHRTLFTVGDFKQAIYGFQGTDPREFERARGRIRERVAALEDAARHNEEVVVRPFRDLSIGQSFRSSQAVLDVVDAVIAEVGPEQMGLPDRPELHRAFAADRPGSVELWRPHAPENGEGSEDEDEEGWLTEPVRRFAGELARTTKGWLREAPVLASTGRALTAGDVLILVRSRGELASLLVARLFAEGVPVAGIDRLHLSSPLAVKDLMAAVAFGAQPLDDLNLANLLVSPLLGWDQDQLYDLAHGRVGSLWAELRQRAGEGGHLAQARDVLGELLRIADFTTPARYLETILSGPMGGRRKLLERLGAAARDPIDELVAAAIEFERSEIASLDRFLHWFGNGEVEIKRDPSAPANAVRVMTVHGAKGLEAPVVILADATVDPANLGEKNSPIAMPFGEAGSAPVLRPRKAEMDEPYATIVGEAKTRDLEEHWRLLYVALTRAKERLVVAGVLPSRGIRPDSWHARVQAAMEGRGAAWDGEVLRYIGGGARGAARLVKAKDHLPSLELPGWLLRPAPVEARPPRPLAPSQIAEDADAAPPPGPELRAAARRGVLLHALFERLPGVVPELRHDAALHWLEQSAGVGHVGTREELARAACSIIGDEAYAPLFAPGSLAEAPVAATLPDGRVVAGTVDRLLVDAEEVRVVDFKTGRQVPRSVAEVPQHHRRQMDAYAEALAVIFPGRPIRTALLYTAGPRLIDLTG